MTLPKATKIPFGKFSNELVIIGAPVYAGRLPKDAVKRFKSLKAENTPAVIIVVYGNREYEDALLELSDLSKSLGFTPLAGGAFIGEHSFCTENLPIAPDRPDEKDIEKAMAFGGAIKQKLSKILSIKDSSPLKVPGNYPYKEEMPVYPAAPETIEEHCTKCGACVDICPKAAVTLSELPETDPNLCIMCCACIKACPTQARIMNDPFFKDIAKWLNEHYSQRKEPDLFT
jgi:ferredoxin